MRWAWVGLAALVLASCEPSQLFLDIQGQVAKVEKSLPMPSIVPAGGAFRTSQALTIAATTPGAHLIYTTDGSGLVYNSHGEVAWPTYRTFSESVALPGLGSGLGAFPVRAVAWKDGMVSPEANVVFKWVGDGGPAWAVTRPGEGLAVSVASDGSRYTGGWTTPDGPGTKAGYVTKWAADGSVIWSVKIGGTFASASSRVTGLAAVPSGGGVYVVGTLETRGTYKLGPTVQLNTSATPLLATPHPGSAGFMTLLSSTGAVQGAVYVKDSTMNSEFNAVALSTTGPSLYVAANLYDPNAAANVELVRVDNFGVESAPDVGPDASGSGSNGFLLKFDGSGNIQGWAGGTAGGGADSFLTVAVNDTAGRVVGGGWYSFEVDYGLGTIASGGPLGYRLPIVLATNLNMNLNWTATGSVTAGNFGTWGPSQLYSEVRAAAVDPSGQIVVGGVAAPAGVVWNWSGPSSVIAGSNSGSGFLVGLSPSGNENTSLSIQSTTASAIRGLSSLSGSVFFAAGDLGSGPAILYEQQYGANRGDLTGAAGRNPLLFKFDYGMSGLFWLRLPVAGSGNGGLAAASHDPLSSVDRVLTTGTQDSSTPIDLGVWGKTGSAGELTFEVFD